MKPPSTESLIGKWALVTGGSGGIGSQIARELASAGANLILHTHQNLENAQKVAQEIQAAIPDSLRVESNAPRVEIVACDFSEEKNLEDFLEQVWRIATVEIVVNNAGMDVLTGEASAWTFAKKMERLWEVDVRATVTLSRAFGRRMQSRSGGAIVNIGWDQATVGMAGDSGEMFATVKGAIMAFTLSLAKSLAPKVRVNCVAPGWIQTKWGSQTSDYWQQRARAEALVERWGTPEDVARAVRFLVSPAASFINGQILNVNGGWAGCVPESSESVDPATA